MQISEAMATEYQLVWDRDWARKDLAQQLRSMVKYANEKVADTESGHSVWGDWGSNLARMAGDVAVAATGASMLDKQIQRVANMAYNSAHEMLEQQASNDANHATYMAVDDEHGKRFIAYDLGGEYLAVVDIAQSWVALADEVRVMGYVLVGHP